MSQRVEGQMEGRTPPTPPPVYRVYQDNDPPPGAPNFYVYRDGVLTLRLRGLEDARPRAGYENARSRATGGPVWWALEDPDEQQLVLQRTRLQVMVERMTEAPEPLQQPVEQQLDEQQQQPIRQASPRNPGRVAHHPEWPEVYMITESRYPGMERQLSAANYSLPLRMRFEVIWVVLYQCEYKMHYDRFQEVKKYKISFRSGPKIGKYHDIQFSSDAIITPWHGVWEYDDMMQEWRGSFKFNWPENQTLKWSRLNRNGPTVWRGLDQENRSIEMVLKVVAYYCYPARNWIYYDVSPNGEMIVRQPSRQAAS